MFPRRTAGAMEAGRALPGLRGGDPDAKLSADY
jgi:hypothetical protein